MLSKGATKVAIMALLELLDYFIYGMGLFLTWLLCHPGNGSPLAGLYPAL